MGERVRGYRVGPELLDSLDRTDLVWFDRPNAAAVRDRRVMPAEADHIERVYGVRPRRVTVRRLSRRFLSREYDRGGAVVLAQVGTWYA